MSPKLSTNIVLIELTKTLKLRTVNIQNTDLLLKEKFTALDIKKRYDFFKSKSNNPLYQSFELNLIIKNSPQMYLKLLVSSNDKAYIKLILI